MLQRIEVAQTFGLCDLFLRGSNIWLWYGRAVRGLLFQTSSRGLMRLHACVIGDRESEVA
jgi:hypothetical protein